MAALVDHLVGHGHRRIALVAGMSGLSTTTERVTGFHRGLERNGSAAVPDRGRRLVRGDRGGAGDGAALGAARAPDRCHHGQQLHDRRGAQSLRRNGIRVPADLALAGFDDFELSDLIDPPLTAIAQNWTTIGHRAIELLVARMGDPDRPFHTERIVASLLIRQSCGCHSDDVPATAAATAMSSP